MAALRAKFIDGLAKRLHTMHKLCDQGGDEALKALQRQAHSLVGAAGLHGLQAVALRAVQLSEALRQGGAVDEARHLLALLDQAVRSGDQPDAQRAADADTAQRRIGVVCQSDDERASLRSLLEAQGHAVQTAASPQDLAPDAQRDLVLLGLQFGDDPAAGLQAIALARQSGLGRAVLVSTSHRGLGQKLAAYRAGAEAVLIKPYGTEELQRAVACALNASARTASVCVLVSVPSSSTHTAAWPQAWHTTHEIASMAQRVEEQACDAVVLTGPVDGADWSDLTRLLRDQAPTLPVVWSAPVVNEALLEAAALSGAAAVVPQSLSMVQLQTVVDRHAVRARAQAQKDQHLRDSLYELNRQRLALDHHAAVSVANASGALLNTSAHHAQLRGCSMEALIGSHLCDPVAGKAPPELPPQAVETARRGVVWQGRLSLHRPDHAPCWVEATLIPFMDGEGLVYRFLLARTDVTRQVTSELQIAALRQAEMDTASAIQTTLLVPPLPPNPAACWVGTCFEAATAVAGDFHELLELAPGCVDVVIGDVMGKGVPAAMVGAAVKLELSRCVHSLTSQRSDRPPTPAEVVSALDRRIGPRLIALSTFVTLSYVRFDPAAQRLTVVGCGHPQNLLSQGGELLALPNKNPPLGILEGEEFFETHHTLQPGASLLMYSDGLSETENPQGEALGEGRIEAAFHQLVASTHWPGEAAQGLLELTRQHRRALPVGDDQTVVVVRVPGAGERLLSASADLTQMVALRQALREHAGGQLPPELIDRMELALCEVFSNIVRHGTSARRGAGIQVRMAVCAQGLCVDVFDESAAFERPATIATPGEDPWAEGGMGLGLIEALCDEVSYSRAHGFNHCHLAVFTAPAPALGA